MDKTTENDGNPAETVVNDTGLKTEKDVAPVTAISNETFDTTGAGTISAGVKVSTNCTNAGMDINDVCIKQESVDSFITTSDSEQKCDKSSSGVITHEDINVQSADQIEGSAGDDNNIKNDKTQSINEATVTEEENHPNKLTVSEEKEMATPPNVDKCEGTVGVKVNANDVEGAAGSGLMEYRSKDNVITVDDTSDSSPDSSDSEAEDRDGKDKVHETTETQINKIMSEQREDVPEQERRIKLNRHGFEDIRTKGELLPEDLPPLEELTITVDESVVMVEVGSVMSIVGILVVIKSKEDVPPLNDDTILFMEGHKVIGQIFEVFGPVKTPWYSVRFNEADNIALKGLAVGMPVYYAPRENSFTKLVFVDNLRNIKGSDASWEDNNEPPPKHLDYSDDEAEKQAKATRKHKRLNHGDNEENAAYESKKKWEKRGNKPGQGVGTELNGRSRNVFEGRNTTWNNAAGANSSSYQSWPPNQARYNRPRYDNTNTMNRPRFGHVTPIGGLNHQPYAGQFNTNSAWAGSKQNASFNSPQPGNAMSGASMFGGQNQHSQVSFDVTRPPPPFMDSSVRPSNMQSFGQNLQQHQQNIQFTPVNTSVPHNKNIVTGFQISNASNPSQNQSMNNSGVQSNTNGVLQYPSGTQQNNMLNQSSIRSASMMNNNMSAPLINNLSMPASPMTQMCAMSDMNGSVPSPLNNQTRMTNSTLQGQHGMMGGSNVTNMAANMMTQQVVQNGGFVPVMNQMNLPRSNFSFQSTSQQPLSNQSYMNAGQLGTPQRFPSQMSNVVGGVNSGNPGNTMFMSNSVQTGINHGTNMQGSIVDPRLIQNNANL